MGFDMKDSRILVIMNFSGVYEAEGFYKNHGPEGGDGSLVPRGKIDLFQTALRVGGKGQVENK